MPEDITQQCRALIVSLGQMMDGEEPLFDSCGDPTIFDEDIDAHPIDSTIKRIIWAIDNDRLPERQPESAVAAQALRDAPDRRAYTEIEFFEELQMRLRHGGEFDPSDLTAIQNVHRRVRSAVEYAFNHADEEETKTKRSTAQYDAQEKLLAALIAHHKYDSGSILHYDPIGSNDLAKLAGVAPSSASRFFRDWFGGHTAYKGACSRDGAAKLNDTLMRMDAPPGQGRLRQSDPSSAEDPDASGDDFEDY